MFVRANFHLVVFLFRHRGEFDAVYLRDESLFPTAFLARTLIRKKIFFEIHSVYERKYRQLKNILAARCATGVIAISAGLQRYYQKHNKHIMVSLCSAPEDSWFDFSHDRYVLRAPLGFPQDTFLVVYAGVVGINPNNDYYEVDDIVKSLSFLPARVMCVIVGEINGNARWLSDIAESIGVGGRVFIVPWQERKNIPQYLQASDVIVIPKRKKDLVGDSPAKMFPALVARRPIIAGRAECIEEVLTDGMDAIVVETNSPKGWADAVLKIYHDQALAERISNQAVATSGNYTWEKRGATIAEFIKNAVRYSNETNS